MDKVELKHLLPASFGVKNGISTISAKVSGTPEKLVHKENIKIDNFKCEKEGNSLFFKKLNIDTNKDNVAYINGILLNNTKTDVIKLPLLKLYITPTTISIPETNIFLANSKLKASGEITNYNAKKPEFAINLNGFVNSRDIKCIKSNFAIYPVKVTVNGDKKEQNLLAQVLMEKALILDEPSIVNIATKFENNNMKIEDLSISSFSGRFSDDYKTNLRGQKKLIISGFVENLKEPGFKNVRVYIPQQLNISYLNTIAQSISSAYQSLNLDELTEIYKTYTKFGWTIPPAMTCFAKQKATTLEEADSFMLQFCSSENMERIFSDLRNNDKIDTNDEDIEALSKRVKELQEHIDSLLK